MSTKICINRNKRAYIYDVKTKGGVTLKLVTCLQILQFLSNMSVVQFCEWWRWGGVKKLVIFCYSHK